jgi:hypothetical protein
LTFATTLVEPRKLGESRTLKTSTTKAKPMKDCKTLKKKKPQNLHHELEEHQTHVNAKKS